ncbi:MAG: phosphoribosylanthranilate isomerase [Ruminiclostridium sp.]
MSLKIKLCGMRRPEDIEYLGSFPPDYAGFILTPGFRRSIDKETFLRLVSLLRGSISPVGVFVDEPIESVVGFAPKLRVIQLHGSENEDYIRRLRKLIPESCEIWKAVRVRSEDDILKADRLPADKLLLDAFSENSVGGTGKTADWDLIAKTRISKPFFAAGGITAANFREAAERLSPYGIDLSGGIETNGAKDLAKIREIMQIKAEFEKTKGN